ncbi:MAG: methyltransferase domain-containing protein [Candidatus Omnitrophica bacterium]|nr:methyltransferase domain-containing protein [Candidatus Omnitrophota bacterium]
MKELNTSDALKTKYNQALQWVKKNTLAEQGVVITSRQRLPYLEVTGYLIPTLMDAGEYALAEQYAEFLAYMQRPNGSFAGADGREYIFDSGQVLRGLAKASTRWERFRPVAKKTADYLTSMMQDSGRLPAIYDGDVPEAVHVFVLPALVQAGEVLGDNRYADFAYRSINFYKNASASLDKKYLTHFLGYIIDGFLDLGEKDFVLSVVQEVFSRQKGDGSISAYPNTSWVCSVGLAQLAIIAYKLNMRQQADKAMQWLLKHQNQSGGFWGSYGFGAKYFPKDEISWANKFFIDALHMKGYQNAPADCKVIPLDDKQWHDAIIETDVDVLANKIRKNDFPVWIKPLLELTAPGDAVLELGSGAGKLAAILALYDRKVSLLDYSQENHNYARALFEKLNLSGQFYEADILKGLPLQATQVDWVYSSGVLEHFSAKDMQMVVNDSLRVCRKGVLCLVPNANALFYRVGKYKMEQNKTWVYGLETPQFTMKLFFESAGLVNIKEYSVGAHHALKFWGEKFPEISGFLGSLSLEELHRMNQGYLLLTYGEKAR